MRNSKLKQFPFRFAIFSAHLFIEKLHSEEMIID